MRKFLSQEPSVPVNEMWLKGSIICSFFGFFPLAQPHYNPDPTPTTTPPPIQPFSLYEASTARTKPQTSPTNPLIRCPYLRRSRPKACRKTRRTCLAVVQPLDGNPFFLSGEKTQQQPVFSSNPAVCYRTEKQMEGWRERESRRGGVEGGVGMQERGGEQERASRGWLTTGRLK